MGIKASNTAEVSIIATHIHYVQYVYDALGVFVFVNLAKGAL